MPKNYKIEDGLNSKIITFMKYLDLDYYDPRQQLYRCHISNTPYEKVYDIDKYIECLDPFKGGEHYNRKSIYYKELELERRKSDQYLSFTITSPNPTSSYIIYDDPLSFQPTKSVDMDKVEAQTKPSKKFHIDPELVKATIKKHIKN